MDLLIANATIYDGTGGAAAVGDVAVEAGRIAAVGPGLCRAGAEVLNAAGLCVAPGFIDIHTHSDDLLGEPGGPRSAENHLRQGVTTIVTGNCGFSTLDVAEYFADLEATGVGVNVLHLLGHNSLRKQVMGDRAGAATADELARMKSILRRGMAAGAAGMSSGLLYFPGAHAATEELIELAKVVGRFGGLYASHLRDERGGALEAVAEAIEIGRRSGCGVQISHLKTLGPAAAGLAPAMCELIEQARAEGLAVTADQYPYQASSTNLAPMAIPKHARADLDARLAEGDFDESLRGEMGELIDQHGRPDGILVTDFKEHRQWDGWTLKQVADSLGVGPVEAVLRILKLGDPWVVCFAIDAADAKLIAAKEYVATGSDGHFCRREGGIHPRAYGTFARKIAEFARDRAWLTLPAAIRSASGLPADILQLPDRGYVRGGRVADLVVFDLAALADNATYADPHQYATGFVRVYLAGRAAVVDDAYTGLLAGRPIRFEARLPPNS